MPPPDLSPYELILPACASCVHDRGDRCVAYPDGIPFRILAAFQHHDEVQADQVGATVFEQDPERMTLRPDNWAPRTLPEE